MCRGGLTGSVEGHAVRHHAGDASLASEGVGGDVDGVVGSEGGGVKDDRGANGKGQLGTWRERQLLAIWTRARTDTREERGGRGTFNVIQGITGTDATGDTKRGVLSGLLDRLDDNWGDQKGRQRASCVSTAKV